MPGLEQAASRYRNIEKAGLCGLLLILAISGTVIALRAFLGPLHILFPINSPLNAESSFGLALVILLVARAKGGTSAPESRERPGRFRGCLAAALLVALGAFAFRRIGSIYFLSDDFIQLKIALSSFPIDFRELFGKGGGIGFYRPVGTLSLILNSIWAGTDPRAWHWSALGLHLANSLLVYLLASRLCPGRLAPFFAAALFSIHGTRPEAVVWISGRFDLLATFFVLGGLLLFMDSRAASAGAGKCLRLSSLGLMILGILSKESAYVFPVLLTLLVISGGEVSRERIKSLLPFFAAAGVLLASRFLLFGDIGGYRDNQTGQPLALTLGLIPVLKVLLLRLWAILFFPINWTAQPGVPLAILTTLLLPAVIRVASSRTDRRHLLFSAGFVLISALPPLHQLLIGPDLLKSRFLYLPSVGFCLMLAQAAAMLPRRWIWPAPAVILSLNFLALQHNLTSWEYASMKARAACAAASASIDPSTKKLIVAGLPGTLQGVYFFANGFQECVELQRKGESLPIEFRQNADAAAPEEGSRFLIWDTGRDELRQAPLR